jgi:hypothetical protein
MSTTTGIASEPVLKNLDRLIPDLEALYKDIHAHPELSMQEARTAGLAADRLRAAGYEVTTGVGKTGAGALLCFGLRLMAIHHGWHLPVAKRPERASGQKRGPDDEAM